MSKAKKTYKPHPACLVFREYTESERHLLTASMMGGYDATKPILLADGKIVAGWHRYQAALDLGIQPVFENRGKLSLEAIYRIVFEDEIVRRHMSPGELAEADVKLKRACGMKFADRGDRRTPGSTNPAEVSDDPSAPVITKTGVAEDTGVSVPTARRAIKRVKQQEGIEDPFAPDPKDEAEDEDEAPDPAVALETELDIARSENETLRERLSIIEDGLSPDEQTVAAQLNRQDQLIRTQKSQIAQIQHKLSDCRKNLKAVKNLNNALKSTIANEKES